MDEAEAVVDRVGRSIDEGRLDRTLTAALDQQSATLTAAWRRDLLLIAMPQLIALGAILAGAGA